MDWAQVLLNEWARLEADGPRLPAGISVERLLTECARDAWSFDPEQPAPGRNDITRASGLGCHESLRVGLE